MPSNLARLRRNQTRIPILYTEGNEANEGAGTNDATFYWLPSVQIPGLGELRVALRDPASGRDLEGFSVADCEPLQINATGAVATWPGHRDLASLHGRHVQIVLSGSRAKVYSFRFEPWRRIFVRGADVAPRSSAPFVRGVDVAPRSSAPFVRSVDVAPRSSASCRRGCAYVCAPLCKIPGCALIFDSSPLR